MENRCLVINTQLLNFIPGSSPEIVGSAMRVKLSQLSASHGEEKREKGEARHVVAGGKMSRVLRQPDCRQPTRTQSTGLFLHKSERELAMCTYREKKREREREREVELSRANEWPTYFIIDSGKFDRR